jgi:hypothetical protein
MSFEKSAVYDANKYLWNSLTTTGVLTAGQYYASDLNLTIIPIVPIQEVPELANHLDDKAYLVYDLSTGPGSVTTDDAWWIMRDEVNYAIYAPDAAKLNQIVNCIRASFKKKDDSARAIQQFLGSNTDFYFHELCFEWGEIQRASKDEQGRYVAEVAISYNYSLKSE